MADLSLLSDADLMALQSNDLSKVSDAGLQILSGNISNIPTKQGPFVGGEMPAQTPQVEQKARRLLDYVAPAVEIPLTLASGLGGQVAGNIYGAYKSLTSPNVGTQQAVEEGKQASQRVQNAMQYQPTSPVTKDVLGGIGETLQEYKLDVPFVPSTGQLGRATSQAAKFNPLPSLVKAEAEKIAPVVESVSNRTAQLLKKEPKTTVMSEQALENQANSLFNKAKQSGVELNTDAFTNKMIDLTANLRESGYDARLHPKLSIAIENLTNPALPKDFKELKTLRTFIQNAQKSSDPTEKMLASRLKSDFDEYLATMPESDIIGGSKEGLKAWQEARNTYSRLSKSQIFTDILNKADLNAGKYSQSGTENYLYTKLRNLANNDRQMRLFTPEEQAAIREAAEGGNVQNALRVIGKYSPSSVLATAGGSYIGASLLGAPGAVIAPLIGAGAKLGATKMRTTQVEKLAELMRKNPNALPEVNWQKPMTMNDRVAEVLRRFNQGEQ